MLEKYKQMPIGELKIIYSEKYGLLSEMHQKMFTEPKEKNGDIGSLAFDLTAMELCLKFQREWKKQKEELATMARLYR